MSHTKILDSLKGVLSQMPENTGLSLDTSVIGTYFLNDSGGHRFFKRVGDYGGLAIHELREALNSAELFFDFLQSHETAGVSYIVLRELHNKLVRIRNLEEGFTKWKFHKSYKDYGKPESTDKRQRIIEGIRIQETNTFNYLRNNRGINLPPNLSSYLESLVIGTTDENTAKIEGLNDEKIVASSIGYGLTGKIPIAIVTRDYRFQNILWAVKEEVRRDPERNQELTEFLKSGGLTIIKGNKEGFRIQYRSCIKGSVAPENVS